MQAKARKIKLQNKVYADFKTGRCYADAGMQLEQSGCLRKRSGCPRLYAQQAGDEATWDAFFCAGVTSIPACPKFCTGECWKRFDELGLQNVNLEKRNWRETKRRGEGTQTSERKRV